ncbi:MAG TPA: LCP family protein [Candidatus Limnocylindrales bacterium]
MFSLIFPGLGQLYAGRTARALAVAAPAILAVALLGGLLTDRSTRTSLVAGLFSPGALQLVLVLDILVGLYRAAAVVDAWRIVRHGGAGAASAGRRPSRALVSWRLPAIRLGGVRDLSLAGLLATLLVLSLGHVALARYDRIAYDTIVGITTPVTFGAPGVGAGSGDGTAASPGSSAAWSAGAAGASAAAASATAPASAVPASAVPSAGSAGAQAVSAAWNGVGRLNVLLVGTDHRAGDVTFNTDTMIVASIDPSSGAVAMFSIPRDTEQAPLEPGTPAAAHFAGGLYPFRLNSLWSYAQQNPGIFPGSDATRGARALKGALGALLGIDIPYEVMVDFSGFQQVVDTLGGAMIDVQLPVQDYSFPSPDDRSDVKLYIPPGFQYMTGAQALEYARARHQTNDFDRAQRQQRVITSMRQETDVLALLDPNRLDTLSGELRSAIHTDFPAARIPALLTLMAKVDTTRVHSYVFTPPIFETECPPAACRVHYYLHPDVAAIQAAVRVALSTDEAAAASRAALAAEGATVWVEAGTKDATRAGAVSDYLDYLGVGAVVPPQHGGRAGSSEATTVVEAFGDAATRLPVTARFLERTFGVTIVPRSDPGVTADFVVIVGAATPNLTLPSP